MGANGNWASRFAFGWKMPDAISSSIVMQDNSQTISTWGGGGGGACTPLLMLSLAELCPGNGLCPKATCSRDTVVYTYPLHVEVGTGSWEGTVGGCGIHGCGLHGSRGVTTSELNMRSEFSGRMG
jgi:hypothetical protein